MLNGVTHEAGPWIAFGLRTFGAGLLVADGVVYGGHGIQWLDVAELVLGGVLFVPPVVNVLVRMQSSAALKYHPGSIVALLLVYDQVLEVATRMNAAMGKHARGYLV